MRTIENDEPRNSRTTPFGNLPQGEPFFHDGALCMKMHTISDRHGTNYVNLTNGYTGALSCNNEVCRVESTVQYFKYK
jgi:hypothetical protein